MKDLSQMSDEELDNAIIEQATAQPQEMDYGAMSDDDLDNMLTEKIMSEAEGPQDRPGEAFAQGFGNAATFGYLPQIQAATEPLVQGAMDMFGDGTDQKLKDQGFTIEEAPKEEYVQRRDRFIRSGQQLAEENPKSSMAGNVTGAIASGIATGGGLSKLLGTAAKATTMAKRFGDAAKTGAAIGFARNPGDTEGELSPLQLKDRATNAAKDAATGMVIQGGLEGIKKGAEGIKNAGKNLKTYSQNKSLKASGAMLKDFRKSFGNKKTAELGQSAIDNKIMNVGDDVSDIAKNAESAKNASGKRIDAIYDEADDIAASSTGPTNFNIRTKDVADTYKTGLNKRLANNVDSDEIVAKVDKVLEGFTKNKNPTFGELRSLRQSIDDKINYGKANNELPAFQDEMLKLRNTVQDKMKESLGKLDPELQKKFIRENKNFSNVAELAKMSKDKMAREEANAAFGLRERVSGGAGAAVGAVIGGGLPGAVVGGAVGAITTKVARQYGTPFVAITANKVARALEKNQNAIGKYSKPLIDAATKSPKEYVAAINLMMKDPEFKKSMDGMNKPDNIYRGPAKGAKK